MDKEKKLSQAEKELLLKYGEIIKTNWLVYLKSSQYYSRLDSITFILPLILNCIANGGLLSSLISKAICSENIPIVISFGVLSAISSIITAISKRYELGEKSKSHLKTSSKYENLYTRFNLRFLSNIEAHFLYSIDDLSEIERELEKLYKKAPIIPSYIQNKYISVEFGKKSDIPKNNIIDSPLQIEFQKRMEEKYKCIRTEVVNEALKKTSSKDIFMV